MGEERRFNELDALQGGDNCINYCGGFSTLFFCFILNLLMLHSGVVERGSSFNGLSWYRKSKIGMSQKRRKKEE